VLVVPDADRAGQPARVEHGRLQLGRQRVRIGDVAAHVRLVPAPDLDVDRERAKRAHHRRRGRVVGGAVRREEHGVRAPTRGRCQGHARPDAEGARLVRRARDDLPRPGRVAVATDDHRTAAQLGPAQHLDSDDELVHVDVQQPGHAVQCGPGGLSD
jgi:hypothetical protein